VKITNSGYGIARHIAAGDTVVITTLPWAIPAFVLK